ncbi:MAG: class I SAM-dependent methyltransferase [Candidatus Omnitrophica bacterium]|nr:class I SAM-dependent methyltransferase [Candidatus Omnitrophota bacterium]MDD5310167.1 class I SAM-dependent methyltransferase [Candidatus Omnitrophota bacterium]MDD5546256.1 class I SAM-dependent methyltransferase [Candidatus Omnitrophota bacterium]
MYAGDELIKEFVPNNECKQISSTFFLDLLLKDTKIEKILDLGCGKGDSVDYFRKKDPEIQWVGLDIQSSPEVGARKRTDAAFVTFNGREIPFADGYFDIIYCNQVLEHAEKPEELINEATRVLKKGGFLVGSTSHLEPFHSLSMYNFTPYGFSLMVKAPLKLKEIRPGIDVFTLIFSRIFKRVPLLSQLLSSYFENESPFNFMMTVAGKMTGRSDQYINLAKLLFCGHFRFLIQKDG